MLIAIIETGAPPDALLKRHGSYSDMMERMLAPLSARFSFMRARVFEGAAPPPLSTIDAVMITGSPAGVYEDHAWIAPLGDFIRRAAAAGKPQVGICFGHQLMAQIFGGRVAKSDQGWGVGVHDYAVGGEAAWMAPRAVRISSVASHQDQVVETPPGAQRLGGSAFCPNAILAYREGPAISFQMHPEFEHDFAADLLRSRAERLPRTVVDDGLASLNNRSNRELIAQWIANFYLSA